MKINVRLLCLFLLFPALTWAGEPVFPVKDIPDSLKTDAHAVIREAREEIKVISADRAQLSVYFAITLLDSDAADYANIAVSFDEKLSRVNNLQAQIYDAAGKSIRKLKRSEITEVNPPESSISSQRYLAATMSHRDYPYTLVVQFQKIIPGLVRYPLWSPQEPYWYPIRLKETAVQKSSLEILIPAEIELSYFTHNLDLEPDIQPAEKNHTRYHWQKEGLRPMELESYGPRYMEQLPKVYLIPSIIKMGRVEGSMKSWEEFGKFYYDLNANRDELPDELKQRVLDMTAGLENPRDKIDTLYRYMQQNTRYVSIQLGIGGWRTFDATYVYENGYGDCKALSNYMKAMLKAVDIPAYAVLVGAGKYQPPVLAQHAYDPFNHVILCVPMEKDTVWLECTSNTNPMGYLGDFTENRHVLLCMPQGGKLVRTPSPGPEHNRQLRIAQVELLPNGDAKVKTEILATGFQQDHLRRYSLQASKKEQEEYVRKRIDAGSFELKAYRFHLGDQGANPSCRLTYEMTAKNWGAASGSRIFLQPNVLEQIDQVPEKNERRVHPILLYTPFLDLDTIYYQLPEGYSIESMPKEGTRIETVFGKYESEVSLLAPNLLRYTRSLQMDKIRLPASYYPEFREFYKRIVKADKLQVVLTSRS